MSANTPFHVLRARTAALTKHRPLDDPELVAARLELQQQVLLDAVAKALAKAPPMTAETRARIVALLSIAPSEAA